MASEHLYREHTASGNYYKYTVSLWFKSNNIPTSNSYFFGLGGDGNSYDDSRLYISGGVPHKLSYTASDAGITAVVTDAGIRDYNSWYHFLVSVDTTVHHADDRVKLYINGERRDVANGGMASQHASITHNIEKEVMIIGSYNGSSTFTAEGNYCDMFNVDGLALTPDVFGYHKDGNGNMSVGVPKTDKNASGQWVPKSPRVIKNRINQLGGFGTNGFYLPFNGKNNPGADFHCSPNTILKLKENLPQPKAEIDGGAPYTNALRDDPFKDYLVYAVPGLVGARQNGFGDYHADIKGSGTNKTVTGYGGNVLVKRWPSFYGSAIYFDGSADAVKTDSHPDFNLGTEDFTIEVWAYRTNTNPASGTNCLWALGGVNAEGTLAFFYENAHLMLRGRTPGSAYSNTIYESNHTIPSQQWDHYCIERYNGKINFYLNGVLRSTSATSTTVTQGHFTLGGFSSGGSYSFLGYLQDARVYKGVAKYKNKSFECPKSYSANNMSATASSAPTTWEVVPDSPANNFAKLNMLSSAIAPFGGGLSFNQSSGGWHSSMSTLFAKSGKWYAECRIDTKGWIMFGVDQIWLETDGRHVGGQNGSKGFGYVFNPSDNRGDITYNAINSYATGGVQSSSAGTILSIAMDLDNNIITFYRNGAQQYTFSGLLEPGALYGFGVGLYSSVGGTLNFGQNPSFSVNESSVGTYSDDSGKGLFKYPPPSGYLALCEDNLPRPEIKDPSKYFIPKLYTGRGGSANGYSRSINGLGFKPDMVWIKKRSESGNHRILDSVRGPTKEVFPNLSNGESTFTGLASFDDDGFTMMTANTNYNLNARDYVAWCWKAGGNKDTFNINDVGYPSTQSAGIVEGTLPLTGASINRESGFSIITYSGGSSNSDTVGHGLQKTPKFIMLKARTQAYYWRVYHERYGLTPTQGLLMGQDSTGLTGSFTHDEYGGIDFVSDDLIGFGSASPNYYNGTNRSGEDYVAYCWAEIDGYSKFGTFLGNQAADGTYVYLGFKPALIILKRVDSNGNWVMLDSARSPINPAYGYLRGTHDGGEETANPIVDFTSNGFKLRNSWTDINADGQPIIFAAWAESPFQTANAK
jgi:hypothetical protein